MKEAARFELWYAENFPTYQRVNQSYVRVSGLSYREAESHKDGCWEAWKAALGIVE